MNRKQLQILAAETVDICEKGSYTLENGTSITIEDDIDDSCINQVYYPAEEELKISVGENKQTKITVVEATTSEAAFNLLKECSKVAILNFASARNPGGGWLSGAKAQEEDLARCSSLAHTLELCEDYYLNNRASKNSLYTDGIIYTPNVVFFRDSSYQLIEPYHLSVVTCPAPNISTLTVREGVVEAIFHRRITRVLQVMTMHGHSNVVLGAWGCGAFGNNPYLVARAFKKALNNVSNFNSVVFAIPDSTSINYQAFKEVFENK